VGGIFFDDFQDTFPAGTEVVGSETGGTEVGGAGARTGTETEIEGEGAEAGLDRAMAFTCAVAGTFTPSYLTVAEKRRNLPFTDEMRHWQLLRRGRYVCVCVYVCSPMSYVLCHLTSNICTPTISIGTSSSTSYTTEECASV
jgi:coproporphyrinogen III oxidase